MSGTVLLQIKTQVLVSNVNSLKVKVVWKFIYDTQVMGNGCIRMYFVVLKNKSKKRHVTEKMMPKLCIHHNSSIRK